MNEAFSPIQHFAQANNLDKKQEAINNAYHYVYR